MEISSIFATPTHHRVTLRVFYVFLSACYFCIYYKITRFFIYILQSIESIKIKSRFCAD